MWDQTHSASGAEPNVDEVDLETPRALDQVLVEEGDLVKDGSAPVFAFNRVVFVCHRPRCMDTLLGIEESVQDSDKRRASARDRKEEKRESVSPAHAS
jgi:hypothetical protein